MDPEFAPAAEIAKILNQVKRKINPPGFLALLFKKDDLPKGDYTIVADDVTLYINCSLPQYKTFLR